MQEKFSIKVYYKYDDVFHEDIEGKRLRCERIFVYDNNVGNDIISLLFSEKQCEIIFRLNEKTIKFHNEQKTFNILIVDYSPNDKPCSYPVINYAINIKNCYPIEYNISDYNPRDAYYPNTIKTICPFNEITILYVDELDNLKKEYPWKKRIPTLLELSGR